MNECLKIDELDVNHIDTLKATPLHVAMRKRQLEAVTDAVEINKKSNRQVFNLNVINSKGQTALHFAIEKQDH